MRSAAGLRGLADRERICQAAASLCAFTVVPSPLAERKMMPLYAVPQKTTEIVTYHVPADSPEAAKELLEMMQPLDADNLAHEMTYSDVRIDKEDIIELGHGELGSGAAVEPGHDREG